MNFTWSRLDRIQAGSAPIGITIPLAMRSARPLGPMRGRGLLGAAGVKPRAGKGIGEPRYSAPNGNVISGGPDAP